jgi:hypothetical protein
VEHGGEPDAGAEVRGEGGDGNLGADPLHDADLGRVQPRGLDDPDTLQRAMRGLRVALGSKPRPPNLSGFVPRARIFDKLDSHLATIGKLGSRVGAKPARRL